MKVEDLVDRDRLRLHHYRLLDELSRTNRLLHRAARDSEHDDKRHLALRARHLEVKSLLLVAEDLDITALDAAPADRAVVEPRPIANELDDAHRSDPYYAPRLGPEVAEVFRPSLHRRPSMHVPPHGPPLAAAPVPAAS